jgi:hypothetical protein
MNRSPHGQRLADGSRQCAKCRKWLQPEAFPPNPRVQDGLGSWCRPCKVAATRRWRADHRTANLSRRRELWAARREEVNAHRRELYAAGKAA